MSNILKKFRNIFMLFAVSLTICLTGCKKIESETLWDSYVEAVKDKDLNKVANMFYSDINISQRNEFLKKTNYFDNIESLEKVSFEQTHIVDYSDDSVTSAFYEAKVVCKVNSKEKELVLYMYKDGTGTYFCSEFNPADEDCKGNEQSQTYFNKVYYSNNNFQYKTVKEKDSYYTVYIENIDNAKNVVIPNEYNGYPIKEIYNYAFFDYKKVICFTISTSKLETIKLPDSLEYIDECAFYQCKNLKEITIPATVKSIGANAFAGCTSLKKIVFNTETSYELDKNVMEPVLSKPEATVKICNATDLIVGEDYALEINDKDKITDIKWSIVSGDCGTIDETTGKLTTTKNGELTVKCEKTNDATDYSTVTFKVVYNPKEIKVEGSKSKSDGIYIVNATNLTAGDVVTLETNDKLNQNVVWSIQKGDATIDATTGQLFTKTATEIEVKAALRDDPANFSIAKIQVEECPTSLSFDASAFYRLNSLQEIYINAENPNSITLANSIVMYIPGSCKIYVPKESLDAYKSHSLWGSVKDMIYPFEK